MTFLIAVDYWPLSACARAPNTFAVSTTDREARTLGEIANLISLGFMNFWDCKGGSSQTGLVWWKTNFERQFQFETSKMPGRTLPGALNCRFYGCCGLFEQSASDSTSEESIRWPSSVTNRRLATFRSLLNRRIRRSESDDGCSSITRIVRVV